MLVAKCSRTLACALVVGVTLAFTPALAYGEKLTVGVEDLSYFPHYAVEEEQFIGFGRDLLDAFAQDRGHTFVYRPLPVRRLVSELINNDVDFRYPDNPYWSADVKAGSNITYSDGVVAFIDGVCVKPKRLGLAAENVRTLGIPLHFTPIAWKEYIASGKVTVNTNTSFINLIKQGLNGRVDGVYGNVDVVNYMMREKLREPGGLIFDPMLPHTEGKYHLSTVNRPDILEDFNVWLSESQPLLHQLKTKYDLVAR